MYFIVQDHINFASEIIQLEDSIKKKTCRKVLTIHFTNLIAIFLKFCLFHFKILPLMNHSK